MTDGLPLFVAVPLGMAILLPLLARRSGVVADVLGNLALLFLAAFSFAVMGQNGLYHMGGWATPIGIDLRLDGLTALLLLAINAVGLTAGLFSVEYMRRYTAKPKYYTLFLLMVAGMNGVVLAGDLFNLYIFMEIAAIASYALVAFGCQHEELEASFKYAVLGGVSSALILVAIALVYGVTGTLNMSHAAARISEAGLTPPLLMALALLVAGFGLKSALVPFHAWLPDAHPSAPAPVSAMLSGVVIKAIGVYVLARLIFNVFGVADNILGMLRMLGALSMVMGVMLAIGQWDMKRLLAYHSISQIGYVVLGLGLGTSLGIAGGLYHLLNHSLFKSLLFLNSGSVVYACDTRDLKKLGGLGKALPVTGATSMVASMSIAGVPPFNGFWSKLIIVMACVEAGAYGLATIAVVVSLITLASFLKVQRYGFFESMKTAVKQVRSESVWMAAAMLLLAAGCLLTSLLVVNGLREPILIQPAVQALTGGRFTL